MVRKKRKKKDLEEDEEGRQRWHDDLHPDTKKSVWAVLSFALAILLLLAWFGKAGAAGSGLYKFFDFLFGGAYLVLPIAFMLGGTSLLFGMRKNIFTGTFLGMGILLVSVLALATILFGREAGGYVGYGISFVPLKFFDTTASVFIFGSLSIISLLILFNVSLVPKRLRREDAKEESGESIEEEALKEKHGMLSGIKASMSGLAEGREEDSQAVENIEDISSQKEESLSEEEQNSVLLPESKLFSLKSVPSNYKPPPLSLLENDKGKPSSGDVRANANIIQRTLQNFGIDVDMDEINVGPSVTQYTLKPAEGVKLSRITNLSSNLGLALAAHPLRIEAPIPGRSLIGIEVPNKSIAFVGLRSLFSEYGPKSSQYMLGFSLGRDVTGKAVYADLVRMPHLLIAGSTGSGKSVTIHSLLLGLLFFNPPERLRLLMIDPKRVELPFYDDIPHLITSVIVDAKKAIQALRWAVKEMERRYVKLQEARARDIISYNNDEENKDIMPYIVVVVDELADLMSAYPREVEASIVRLAQMARAVGIHLVVSTQRPSVDVITGLIKANITTRIALRVISQTDSRTIIDMGGAEKLLGKGDMLYLSGDSAKPKRVQGVYVSEEEVKRATKYLREQKEELGDQFEEEDIFAPQTGAGDGLGDDASEADDEMYEDARTLVLEAGKASTSLLQRRLRLGYARAARLVDMLEDRGVVGPADGSKPREVLVEKETALEREFGEGEEERIV